MFFRSDDPIKDFERYDRAQAAYLRSLPKCLCCGEPIHEGGIDTEGGILCSDECYEYYYSE